MTDPSQSEQIMSSSSTTLDDAITNSIHPEFASNSLTPSTLNRASSLTAMSTQSMRTSSFAMSDVSETKSSSQQPDSVRIRNAYSRPLRSRTSALKNPISEPEDVDYHDEKDFRNTDRYKLIQEYSVDVDMVLYLLKRPIVSLQKLEIELLVM
jgi:hypothetical protein